MVKSSFFDPVPDAMAVDTGSRFEVAPTLQLALGITAAVVIIFGVFPGLIAELADFASEFVAIGF